MWAFQRGHVPICCLKPRFFFVFFSGGVHHKNIMSQRFLPQTCCWVSFTNQLGKKSRLRVNDGTKAKRVGLKVGIRIHQLMEAIHPLIIGSYLGRVLYMPGG